MLVPLFPLDSDDRAGVFVLLDILVILSLYVYSYYKVLLRLLLGHHRTVESWLWEVVSCYVIMTWDARGAYWQLPVSPSDRWLTVIVTPSGLWEWTRTPFGMHNSGSTFVRAIQPEFKLGDRDKLNADVMTTLTSLGYPFIIRDRIGVPNSWSYFLAALSFLCVSIKVWYFSAGLSALTGVQQPTMTSCYDEVMMIDWHLALLIVVNNSILFSVIICIVVVVVVVIVVVLLTVVVGDSILQHRLRLASSRPLKIQSHSRHESSCYSKTVTFSFGSFRLFSRLPCKLCRTCQTLNGSNAETSTSD